LNTVPAKIWAKDFEGGVVERLGSFQTASSFDLQHVRLVLVKAGAWVGSEQVRLKVYGSSSYETPIYTSQWLDLDAIAGGGSEPAHWIGNVRFDFSPAVPVNSAHVYYLAAETASYTKTASFYIGAMLDWPEATYHETADTKRSARMVLFGLSAISTEDDPMSQVRQLQIAEGVTVSAPTQLQTAWTYDDTTGWDGVATSVVYNLATLGVSNPGAPADARKAKWTLLKESGGSYFEVGAEITATSATSVTVAAALLSGTYRLHGVY
jgi:hypothetical protein